MTDYELDAEPLTEDKVRCPDCRQTDCDVLPHEVLAEDVAAAVRKLKEDLKNDLGFQNCLGDNEKQEILRLIDEAFPGVVENSDKECDS